MATDTMRSVADLIASPPPWMTRVLPWVFSAGSLTLGLATLFVFRRGLPNVNWIVGYLLLVALLITVVAELRVPWDSKRLQFVVGAAEYLLQTLCHGMFLFVLPAYYTATTFTSRNAWLLVLIAAAALLTAIDPWYAAIVHPRPWLRSALLGLAMFAGLNIALALLGLPPILAAVGGAGLTGLALIPALRPAGSSKWRGAQRGAMVAIVAVVAVWLNPAWVPPAPMFVAGAVAARDVLNLQPVGVVDGRIDAATVMRWGSLAAYTAVYAPAGMRQGIEHVWQRDGVEIARIPLTPIRGGRREGFRTYSRHVSHERVAGRYRVDVMTSSGQLVGRLAFTVTP